MFIHRDIEILEVNPLVLTPDEQFMVKHVGIKIESNSLFRQQGLLLSKDRTQQHYKERIAAQYKFRYVHIPDGNIGLIANGAGCCLAT